VSIGVPTLAGKSWIFFLGFPGHFPGKNLVNLWPRNARWRYFVAYKLRPTLTTGIICILHFIY